MNADGGRLAVMIVAGLTFGLATVGCGPAAAPPTPTGVMVADAAAEATNVARRATEVPRPTPTPPPDPATATPAKEADRSASAPATPAGARPTPLPEATQPPPAPTITQSTPTPALGPPSTPTAAVAQVATATPDRDLERRVESLLRGLGPGASAVWRNLSGPERVELDATVQVPAASTIKLPLLATVYRQADLGVISLDQRHTIRREDVVGGTGVLQRQVGRTLTTRELLATTLRYSDNTGGNLLVRLVGQETVNAFMQELGLTQTRFQREFLDTRAQQRGLENLTSAADLADLLTRVYHGRLVSPAASAELYDLLRQRGAATEPELNFLARRLQPRPTLAQLNGVLTGVRNDAAIIEHNGRAYVVVSLLRGQTDERAAEDRIATASQQLFRLVSP